MRRTQITPWWETMYLREEVTKGDGDVDDVQMSLYNAVFGVDGVGAGRPPYADPGYYASITHPSAGLVQFMARIAVRLGARGSTQAQGMWHLDQAMGGGKSHGLIGLWHLAAHPTELAHTELGRRVADAAADIAGAGKVSPDLNNPICVVLDCDNTTATEKHFGPAEGGCSTARRAIPVAAVRQGRQALREIRRTHH